MAASSPAAKGAYGVALRWLRQSNDPHTAADFYQHVGLHTGGAHFTHDDVRHEWQVRIGGIDAVITTPGGVGLYPGGVLT